jgi:hypothetical protein
MGDAGSDIELLSLSVDDGPSCSQVRSSAGGGGGKP